MLDEIEAVELPVSDASSAASCFSLEPQWAPGRMSEGVCPAMLLVPVRERCLKHQMDGRTACGGRGLFTIFLGGAARAGSHGSW